MTNAMQFPTAPQAPTSSSDANHHVPSPGSDLDSAVLEAWARRWGTPDELVVLASSPPEATNLNVLARAALRRLGHLRGPAVTAGGVELSPGDRVVAGPGGIGRPGGYGVPEGCPGDVRLVDPAGASVVIEFPTVGVVRLRRSHLGRTPLRYGYAVPAPPGFGWRIGGVRLAHPTRSGAEIA
jgi:hypothetical protein